MRRVGAVMAAVVLSGMPAAGRPCWKPQASVPVAEYPSSTVQENGRTGAGQVRREVEPRCRTGRVRAYDLMVRGKYTEALKKLDRVVEACPEWCLARLDRARTSMLLGYLRWDRGLVEKAVEDYSYCCSMRPHDIAPCWLEKVAAELLGRIDRTRALRQRIPKENKINGN
ncbi:MAG: hypothetical protein D6806_07360 [Deltaproteobacteria bacterium]|nr:MAG: hypothetical protein D6806_07360 [Deltaproteobacteria bacterium]